MKTKSLSLHRKYNIECKMFLPENAEVKHVIIGVHGFAGDKESSMLKKLADGIVDNGGALICFDFPAHGDSPVGDDCLTIENCKNDLLAVVEYIKEKYPNAQKSIFATSFGGYITLLCYNLLCEFRFVLRAPAITMPDLLLNSVLKIQVDEFKSMGIIECGFERKIKLPYSFYSELLCQENLLLNDYQNPILIIHGDVDDIVPVSVIEDFAVKRKNIELYIIKGADHRFKNAGEIQKIVSATRKFLNIY